MWRECSGMSARRPTEWSLPRETRRKASMATRARPYTRDRRRRPAPAPSWRQRNARTDELAAPFTRDIPRQRRFARLSIVIVSRAGGPAARYISNSALLSASLAHRHITADRTLLPPGRRSADDSAGLELSGARRSLPA